MPVAISPATSVKLSLYDHGAFHHVPEFLFIRETIILF
jgi:hypothetical protein